VPTSLGQDNNCPVRMNLTRSRFTDLWQDNFTRTPCLQTVRVNLAHLCWPSYGIVHFNRAIP
jgi:hypothetical protein